MEHKVLIVDDEEKILSALKRTLIDESYDLLLADGGKKGVEIIDSDDISVVIADLNMPEMDGVEFLKVVMQKQPDAVRIVLSGYDDSDSFMSAINEGNIWHYIAKPWQDEDLKLNIRNAVKIYENTIERKSLLAELEEKNEKLSNMNETLELMVKERTWELKERTNILNMLLEDEDISVILEKSCNVISKVLKIKSVFIFVPFWDSIFHSEKSEKRSPDYFKEGIKKAMQKKETVKESEALYLPLLRGESMLGVLIIEDLEDASLGNISRFSAIISLALCQQKAIKEAPDLLKSVDNIINNIGDIE